MTAEHEERLDEVKWWREDDEASAALAIAEHPTRYTEQFELERPTREQVEELQRQAARQVYDEWVAAGRPCTPLRKRPLTVRFELAPGFGLAWLSLLALCCELRGGIVDAKGCGLDDG